MSVSVFEAIQTGGRWLSDAGIPNAEKDARVLLAHAMDCEAGRLLTMPDEQVSPEVFRKYDGYLSAREKFQPVSQIIGGREFWGRWFVVTQDVLDPRPETESLIECALQGGPKNHVLDLGTGSGILAVTLAAEWPEANILATDISMEAMTIAAKNADTLAGEGRVEFQKSDWFAKITGQFDLIVSNPPYISAAEMPGLSPDVLNWEPMLALTPGGDGLDAYRIIAAGLDDFLAKDGLGLFEIGHLQGADVCNIFKCKGFANVTISKDLGGKDRIISVMRQ